MDVRKRCSKCGEEKELGQFYADARHRDGRQSRCKTCWSNADKLRYQADPESKKARSRAWTAANPKRASSMALEWSRANRDRSREIKRKWEQSNKAKVRYSRRGRYDPVKRRAKHDQHRERDNTANKRYRDTHKDERREYMRRRRDEDQQFRLRGNLRARFRAALKRGAKIGSAVSDLGCTIPELMAHLEAKFQPGMTWENYGVKGWHIDHIRPLDAFDLTDPTQVKLACHYTNLQPLWWQDNLKKGPNP